MSRKYFKKFFCKLDFIDFSVHFDAIAVDNVSDIHKYFMKRNK